MLIFDLQGKRLEILLMLNAHNTMPHFINLDYGHRIIA